MRAQAHIITTLDEFAMNLTVSEVRKLLCRLVLCRRPPLWEEVLRWSVWRRRHQAVAKRCHYKRRGVLLA
jgi:hypothetical protein